MIQFHYQILRTTDGLSQDQRVVADETDKAANRGSAKRKVTNKVKWVGKPSWRQIKTHPIDDPDNETPVGIYIKRDNEHVAIIKVIDDAEESDG